MAPKLSIGEDALAAFCRANGVQRLSLFGSRLKGTARGDSDVDLLVEFAPQYAARQAITFEGDLPPLVASRERAQEE